MQDLQFKIQKIGESLVRCPLKCEGVANQPEKGIIPRCLLYEKRNSNKPVIIVVGMNPGKCRENEQNHYLSKEIGYQPLIDYWNKKISSVPYYKKARDIINPLGFDGDIVWSDLAKCECSGPNGSLPMQTFRICVDRFLKKEIDVLPENTEIITLGDLAFQYCSLLFPDKFVLGLPHPSYRGYYTFRNNIIANNKKYLELISQKRDNHGYLKALKLFK